MKKFLLFAAAAIVAVSANAQLASKKAMPKSQASVQQKIALPEAKFKKMELSGAKKNVGNVVTSGRVTSKLSVTDKQMKNLKSAQDWKMAQTAFRRAAAPEYIATGFVQGAEEGSQWQTLTGTSTDGVTLLIKDVIPNPFTTGDLAEGVIVPYTIEAGQLIIQPTLVASVASEDTYLFLCDFANSSKDGVIRLDIEEDGVIQTINSQLAYVAFSTANFDPSYKTSKGYWEVVNNVKYRRPGDAPEPPVVLAQPGNTVLFLGQSYSGYHYIDNLAVLPAYTDFILANGTQDYASSCRWSANQVTEDEAGQEVVTPLAADTRNFAVNTNNPDAAYEAFKLVGLNEDVESEEYTWGYGHALDEENALEYEDFHAYAGGKNSNFKFTDGTYATMTTHNPDGALAFYGAYWSTPDLALQYGGSSVSKIYAYQGKPAAPIYFTGVTLPLVAFEFKDEANFKLHINIYKCHRDSYGDLTLGDLIAQSDVTSENVDNTYASSSGLTGVIFDGFYVEDEDGMSEDVDFLQLDDEFVIEITDWDNGTFTGVLGCQDLDVNSIPSAYFTKTGEEKLYRFVTWFPTLFVGLNDAVTGYLHTTDNTNITIANEGGEEKIKVEPMIVYVNEETGEPETGIWLDESSEDVPEWLSITWEDHYELDEEGYLKDGANFEMFFKAEALPAEVEGRQVHLVFMQPGAFLHVTVKQGNTTGISVTKKVVKMNNNTPAYNLAGQRLNKNFKGLVVKDGQKFMRK